MGVDPISMMIIGSVISAGTSIMGGMQQKDQANYQAAVARNNAEIAKRNAVYAEQVGVRREQEEIYKVRDIVGATKAAQGASGLSVGVGSGADVIGSTSGLGLLSVANVRDVSAREAYGFRVQETNFENEAKAAKVAGKNAMMSGFIGAATSLIGGATQVGKMQAGMRTSGVPQSGFSLIA
jgi:hypothetical protein